MKRPVRVAYLDHVADLGGAEHVLLNLLSQMPPDRIVPTLICSQEGDLSERARAIGVATEIVRLPPFFSTSWLVGNEKVINPFAVIWNAIGLYIGARRIVRRIEEKQLQVDVVQTNTVLSHVYGGITARALRVPCVWYFHDLVERRRLAGLMAWTWGVLARSLASCVVADSRAALQSLAGDARGTVIHPSASTPEFRHDARLPSLRERLHLSNSSILLGSLGRIAYVKGLDVLIDAARIVVSNNGNVHFIIFGGALFGEGAYLRSLETRVKALGLSQNWHWLGYDNFAKEYLRELDFFVFPSRREAFGLSAVEAGLSGKAVIASRVGGIPEIVEDGKTGILVPPGQAEDLARAIMTLVRDPALGRVLGKRAQSRTQSLFTNERYRKEFLAFYESVVAETALRA